MVNTLLKEKQSLETQAATAYKAGDFTKASNCVKGAISRLIELSGSCDGKVAEAYRQQEQQLRKLDLEIQKRIPHVEPPRIRVEPEHKRMAPTMDHLVVPRLRSPEPAMDRAEVPSCKQSTVDGTLNFTDLVGMEDFKATVDEKIIEPMRNPEWAHKCAQHVGGGILMYGPPGTGKTYAAQCIAGELEMPFYPVNSSDVISSLVGESEKNLAQVFAQAREKGGVIFFDEFDGLCASRDTGANLQQHEVKFIDALKTEMDGLPSKASKTPLLVLAASNCPWRIDRALQRPGRFDSLIYVGLPTRKARQQFLEYFCHKHDIFADPVVLKYVAAVTEGYSNADMEALCMKAGYYQFKHYLATNKSMKFHATLPREAFEYALTQIHPSVKPEDELKLKAWGKHNS